MWIGIAVVIGIWLLHVWWRPYIDCAVCGGNRKDYDSEHKHFRIKPCIWCLNTGMRLRWELRLVSVLF